jgi:hypothetical protein
MNSETSHLYISSTWDGGGSIIDLPGRGSFPTSFVKLMLKSFQIPIVQGDVGGKHNF